MNSFIIFYNLDALYLGPSRPRKAPPKAVNSQRWKTTASQHSSDMQINQFISRSSTILPVDCSTWMPDLWGPSFPFKHWWSCPDCSYKSCWHLPLLQACTSIKTHPQPNLLCQLISLPCGPAVWGALPVMYCFHWVWTECDRTPSSLAVIIFLSVHGVLSEQTLNASADRKDSRYDSTKEKRKEKWEWAMSGSTQGKAHRRAGHPSRLWCRPRAWMLQQREDTE